jgi:hypothetical protein
MKFIANILTNKPFPDEGIFNVVSDKANLIEDIPTLVIGWEYTKLNYPQANILEWQIDKTIYWTFGRREKGERYEEAIRKFKELSFKYLKGNIRYEYINLLTKDKGIESLITILTYNNIKVFISDDMLYLFLDGVQTVYGISIKEYEYLGGSKKQLFNILYSYNNITIVTTNDDIFSEIKPFLKNSKYIVPYLF